MARLNFSFYNKRFTFELAKSELGVSLKNLTLFRFYEIVYKMPEKVTVGFRIYSELLVKSSGL